MIQISQLKLKPDQGEDALKESVRQILHLRESDEFYLEIRKKSIDARKKPDIFYVYTLGVTMKDQERERKILKKNRDRNVTKPQDKRYEIPDRLSGRTRGDGLRPVIVGTGPAGLFCGLALARAGLRPILLERGQSIPERTAAVGHYWEGGQLDPESNVQFGEGGAGTFSDGKLNTGVKDPYGRIRFVLDTFVGKGADPDILYSYRPHVGTDVLKKAVAGIRDEIIARGGEVRFSEKLIRLTPQTPLSGDVPLWDLEIAASSKSPGPSFHMNASTVVLAIGHSSRDTFRMLKDSGFDMTAKAFAVGLRIQHPQGMIDEALYGKNCPYEMPPSPYKLTHRLSDGRGVYSFCMCPGGYVVNASSEARGLAVNGMSYHDRASGNANSAIVVTVSPEEIAGCLKTMRRMDASDGLCGKDAKIAGLIKELPRVPQEEDVLSGMEFQRRLERIAYLQGRGKIPVQTFGDYRRSRGDRACGEQGRIGVFEDRWHAACGRSLADSSVRPVFQGAFCEADVRSILPGQIADAIEEGILAWDRQIAGFADPSALLAGVESRTSSPVRITRGEDLQAAHCPGIYPCGEGAGYAGGITSAAVDGLRVAEAILAS